MTLADVAAIKVKATRHHNEIKRMNALKSKAKNRKTSDTVREGKERYRINSFSRRKNKD